MKKGVLYLSILFIVISICLISAQNGVNESCTPNWNCTEWSKCMDGNKIRSCVDFNLCGDISTKPDEIQECASECIPVWNCSKWQPEKCSKDETQTRVCNDLNNCGESEQKPSEARTCKRNSLLLFIILVITIITASIMVTIAIIEKITKKSIIELFRKKKSDKNKNIKRPFQYKSIKRPPPGLRRY